MTRLLPLLLLATAALGDAPKIALEEIAGGLNRPVAITHAGDSRLFLILQPGQIMVHDGNGVLPLPFLDIRSLVSDGGERGLLSAAFHPRYAQNGFFYVNYTDVVGDTVVARYSVYPFDPNRADPFSALILLHIRQPFSNHNGGQLQFGPDGYLYIGMGDGGGLTGDPGNRAQNLGDLLGKMLRIDVDGGPYTIPPSNPFVGVSGARPEIWSYGFRNPWRFSFDRGTGDLWIADVGQGSWEEVHYQPASSRGGENYGWRLMEGTHCYIPETDCNDGSLVLPVIEYPHTGGACSVTGGYVYRGTRNPRLKGMYVYGDYCSGNIWGATRHANGAVVSQLLADVPFPISSFGEDASGEIYVADHFNGRVLRLVDTAPPPGKKRSVRH